MAQVTFFVNSRRADLNISERSILRIFTAPCVMLHRMLLVGCASFARRREGATRREKGLHNV